MSKPKRHHTVPRVYLEQFVDSDQRLTIYSKRRRKALRPKPSEALVRFHYYSQPVNGVENADQTIESKFLNELETTYPDLLQGLTKEPQKVDIYNLAQTLCMLRARSPAFREAFELGLADYVNNFVGTIPRSEFPEPPAGFEDIWEKLVVTIDPHRSLQAMAHYIKTYSLVLTKLEYSVMIAPKGAEFLTSDNPVVWFETGFQNRNPIIYSNTISSKTRAAFPMSKKLALVGRPSVSGEIRVRSGHFEASRRFLRELNEIQTACAWDEVVGIPKLPRMSWERLKTLAPRMDITHFDPNSGNFTLLRTYLDILRQKHKFHRR